MDTIYLMIIVFACGLIVGGLFVRFPDPAYKLRDRMEAVERKCALELTGFENRLNKAAERLAGATKTINVYHYRGRKKSAIPPLFPLSPEHNERFKAMEDGEPFTVKKPGKKV